MKKIANPANPFHSRHRDLLEPPSDAKLEVYEDASRTILSKNDSPDISFKWSVNPYRGCFHSCAYCYARQYHEYLDMGAGTDFESKIAVKKDAPRLLREAFMKKSWIGENVVFSGATDCYQPLEAVYELTRGCLEVCLEFRNPVSIITKSFLITRDVDLLADLNREAECSVALSIPFAHDDLAKIIEPQAASITRRFQALEILSKHGIPTAVSLAPTIPGLNENDIPAILKRAKDCGASYAFQVLLRLPGRVEQVFEEKIKAGLPPERAERVLNRIRETRGGAMYKSSFGSRMTGEGTYWKSVQDLFRLHRKKYGLDQAPAEKPTSTFKRPSPQLELNI